VVEAAVSWQGLATESVSAGPDLIQFRALPLFDAGRSVGAVWVMQRLIAIHSTQQQLYGIGLIGVLGLSGAIVAAAWLFTHRLDRGVTRIEESLRAMEEHLETPVPATAIPELDRVGSAINQLAHAVQAHQRERTELERRLHRSDHLAALGRLIGGVAHEVRNPLASIKLKLHLARRSGADPERLNSAFEVIQGEVERLDRLVERLLTLAKSSEPSRAPTDLVRLLKARMELWEGRAAEQEIVLELQPAPSIGEPALVDGDRIVQIVDNLLANAVEALHHRGGRITVELERPAPLEIRVAVADTGPGVPPEMVDRLSEPFFTTRDDGTGLGLFLSAEMTRALGGELRYREQPGGGACFEVMLPC
jgi:signal transduction histidine kinase